LKSQRKLITLLGVIGMGLGINACSPPFNWRELQPFQDGLMVQLPCKADIASRKIKLNQQELNLEMAGCEAQGMMFVVAKTNLNGVTTLSAIQTAWLESLKQNIKAPPNAGALATQRAIAQKISNNSVLNDSKVYYYQGFDTQNKPISMEVFWLAKNNNQVNTVATIEQQVASSSSSSAKTVKVPSSEQDLSISQDLYQIAVFYPTPKKPSASNDEALQTFFQGLTFQ
jgi:hypothetical protein